MGGLLFGLEMELEDMACYAGLLLAPLTLNNVFFCVCQFQAFFQVNFRVQY